MVFANTKAALRNTFKKFGEAFSSVKSIFTAFKQDIDEISRFFESMWAETARLAKGIIENIGKTIDNVATYMALQGHVIKSSLDAYVAGAGAMRTASGVVGYLSAMYDLDVDNVAKQIDKISREVYVIASLDNKNNVPLDNIKSGLMTQGYKYVGKTQDGYDMLTKNQKDTEIAVKIGPSINVEVKKKY